MRHIPLDAIARRWYVLVAGVSLGLIFSLVTGVTPCSFAESPNRRRAALAYRGCHNVGRACGLERRLPVCRAGFLAACGLIWLLEEIRIYGQRVGKP